MIGSRDSSFDRPNFAQAAVAFAAGVRVWGGYIGTRSGLGLATLWSQADFAVVQNAGMTAIGFCSGWEDPIAIRDLARAWGVLLCPDVEPFIRDDGPWVGPWVSAAGSGLYGLPSVHYQTGEPNGRGAAFNIMADYPGFDPGVTWGAWLPMPPSPHGWQWQGSHSEFGLSVDASWLDDWFGPRAPKSKEETMIRREPVSGAVYVIDGPGKRHIGPLEYESWKQEPGFQDITITAAAAAEIPDVGVPSVVTTSLTNADLDAIAGRVLQHLSKDTAAG